MAVLQRWPLFQHPAKDASDSSSLLNRAETGGSMGKSGGGAKGEKPIGPSKSSWGSKACQELTMMQEDF